MLKFHEIFRPSIPDSYFEQAVDLWLGFDAGHLGSQMYQDHKAMMGQRPMSGVLTWENYAKHGTFPNINKDALLSGIKYIFDPNCMNLPLIEFGPGSMEDASLLVKTFQPKEYIPVDYSVGVIKQAMDMASLEKNCLIRPAVLDFFAEDNSPLIDSPALGILLGVTISNIPGPIPEAPPSQALIKAFQNITCTMPAGGFFLVSMDTCQDEKLIKSYYNEPWHRLFGVNHIYRMVEELPMHNFDPDGFEYYPVWHENCGLLAHTVRAMKDQIFEMGKNKEIAISVKEGDVFHYNNSFKYNPEFFEDCAEKAGLKIIRHWQGVSTIRLYLFSFSPKEKK